MPKVSIIIRTKNEEQWIKHCLKMIDAQSYRDFEVVLVDNESEDATVAIARRHGVKRSQIMRWNGLKSRRVHPGTKLEIRTGKK